jgi:hypothetical protein
LSNNAVLIRGLDRNLYNKIVARAKEQGKNVADIVNDAMRAYIDEGRAAMPSVFDTKKLVFTGSVNLSKSDILGLHEELGQFQLENSGTLTLDKDIDKEAFHRIERIHNTGKLRVPSNVHHLALLKIGHVHGEVEKY